MYKLKERNNNMATRCTIKVDGVDYVKIYKHWDGYPENMLQPLIEWN